MTVSDEDNQGLPLLKPIRGGAHESHEFFLARLIPVTSSDTSSLILRTDYYAIDIPVFYDSGSICSWVEPGLAGVTYRTKKPVQLAGIGGKTGPRVRHDALLRLRFRDTNGAWTPVITISCGICERGTFPAPLTIGRHVGQQLDIGYSGRNLCLGRLPNKPLLPPLPASSPEPTASTVFTTSTSLLRPLSLPTNVHNLLRASREQRSSC